MSCLSILNILIYIYLSIFQDLFLGIINDLFYLFAHIVLDLFDYICTRKKLFKIRFF
jgi:hypothetical protein